MRRSIFGYLEQDSDHSGLKLSRKAARHEEWTEAILPADAPDASPEGETDRRPLMVFACVAAFALAILVGRLVILQLVTGEDNLALANGNRTREKVARAPRGMIYDRTGVVLARNQASFDVTVIPQLLPEVEADRRVAYEKVGALIGLPAQEVAAKAEITCRVKTPGCLQSPIPQLVAAGVERDKALLLDQASSELKGFALDVNPIREYQDEGLLSVFLGYTGRVNADEVKTDRSYGPTDLIGKNGLEKYYEKTLRGQNGGERTEVDAMGRPVRVLASRDPQPGNNLVLSLDMALQRRFATALMGQMNASRAVRASGVALNPKTGEILAAVSLPSYDNNLFSRGISQVDYQRLVKDPGQPLYNKVTSGAYPSGSVIKPMGVAAALQEGIINGSTLVLDTGKITVPNKYDPSKPAVYHGWERVSGLGLVNPLTAIARSSDIFFYKVMGGLFGTGEDFTRPLGVTKLTQYYKKFGFGSRTGVDLPSETPGRVPTPEWKKKVSGEGWYTGDTYNISVGQGDMLVSPLQMAVATAAVANGGTVYEPQFVREVTDSYNKVVEKFTPSVVRSNIIDPGHLATVRRGMWMTVNDPQGTACCKIKDEVPVPVAAKTGTAETVIHDEGIDPLLQSRPHAWFEAFAPYDNPEIVMVALVEHAGEGSQFAAPAVRETLRWYFTEGAGVKR